MKKLYASPPINATANPCVAQATNPFNGGMAPIPPAGRRATGPGPKSSGLRLISRSATRAVCRNMISFDIFFVLCFDKIHMTKEERDVNHAIK